jgi:hypothetical protein
LETRAEEKNIVLLTLFLITICISILIVLFILPMVRTNKKKKEEILSLFFYLQETEVKNIGSDFESFSSKINTV